MTDERHNLDSHLHTAAGATLSAPEDSAADGATGEPEPRLAAADGGGADGGDRPADEGEAATASDAAGKEAGSPEEEAADAGVASAATEETAIEGDAAEEPVELSGAAEETPVVEGTAPAPDATEVAETTAAVAEAAEASTTVSGKADDRGEVEAGGEAPEATNAPAAGEAAGTDPTAEEPGPGNATADSATDTATAIATADEPAAEAAAAEEPVELSGAADEAPVAEGTAPAPDATEVAETAAAVAEAAEASTTVSGRADGGGEVEAAGEAAASEAPPTATPAASDAVEAAAASTAGSAGPDAAAAEGTSAEAAKPEAAAPGESAPGEALPEPAQPEPAKPEEPEDPALTELREAREKGTPVEGRVIGWNRGGFHVVVGSLTAFCPSSEMEVGRPKSPASYVEQTFPFKVIKVQKKGKRVVLSRSAILGEQRQEVIGKLEPGSVVSGRVTSLPDFGAFVDLGGVEGLVHVSEISRSRVQHPRDALKLGQEVEVKVLKVEKGGERISLSIKDLEPDPWRGANERFGRGDRFSGKVLRKADFGLFIELEPEVEGLLHVSQLPPGKSFDDEAYQPGQPIEGWVRDVEPKRQRISLSLREVPTEDPWKQIGQRFPEGESVEGVVESVAPFGVFITLGPGVTGLLPNSQTGLPRGTNAARAFSPGQTVRVQVISVDQRRKRISLGREGSHVEASKGDLQDFKRREKERVQESPTAMAAAFARLRGGDESE